MGHGVGVGHREGALEGPHPMDVSQDRSEPGMVRMEVEMRVPKGHNQIIPGLFNARNGEDGDEGA